MSMLSDWMFHHFISSFTAQNDFYGILGCHKILILVLITKWNMLYQKYSNTGS